MTRIECCGTTGYECDRVIEAPTPQEAYDLAARESWAPVGDDGAWRCPWCRNWQAQTDAAEGDIW